MDKLIGYLQSMLERKIPMIPYARLSGADGMRLSRAAFAVMLKFSDSLSDTATLCTDEIDMMSMDLENDPEKDLKIKEALKTIPNFDALMKRWESASKMRIWISDKKKNLSEKLKKEVETEYKKKKEEEKKAKEEAANKEGENKEQQKVEEAAAADPKEEEKKEVKVEEIELIDTSSKPKVEEKAAEENPATDSSGLSEEDKANIEKLLDEKFETELQSIYGKIVEKAEFLVKLQVPLAYLSKDSSLKKHGTLLLIKDPSNTENKEGASDEINWKDRLKSWRQMQTSKGAIKSFTERNKEIFDSSIMSILACLQTAINTQKI